MTIQTYKKAHDPTDNQLRLAVGSLFPAIASVGKDQQILRWPLFFQLLIVFQAASLTF